MRPWWAFPILLVWVAISVCGSFLFAMSTIRTGSPSEMVWALILMAGGVAVMALGAHWLQQHLPRKYR